MKLINAHADDHGTVSPLHRPFTKPRRFFYHYNKPASRAAKAPRLSIHFDGQCHIVSHIKCLAACETHHQARQPRCVMRGKTFEVMFVNEPNGDRVAIIT